MEDWRWFAAAVVLAGLLATLFCRVTMSFGVKDAPDEARKTQAVAVPTSGGLGFALAAILTIAAIAQLNGVGAYATLLWLGLCAFAALLLGAADDLRPVPARLKLIAMLAIALGMAALDIRADTLIPWPETVWILPPAVAALGAITWTVVVMNAVNFMDGANGLSMGMAAIAAFGFAICGVVVGAPDIALTGAALTGALCGFLWWNIPGRLFAGDAGALFAGTVLAGLGLMLVKARPDLLFVPPLLLAPFLTDVLLTLVWRTYRGKALFAAHLDHAYQIALKTRLTHLQVSGIHGVWAANAALVAIVATIAGGYTPTLAGIAMLLVGGWVHMRVRSSGVKAGLVGSDQD